MITDWASEPTFYKHIAGDVQYSDTFLTSNLWGSLRLSDSDMIAKSFIIDAYKGVPNTNNNTISIYFAVDSAGMASNISYKLIKRVDSSKWVIVETDSAVPYLSNTSTLNLVLPIGIYAVITKLNDSSAEVTNSSNWADIYIQRSI